MGLKAKTLKLMTPEEGNQGQVNIQSLQPKCNLIV